MYENMLVQGLSKFLKSQSEETNTSEDELRLVVKMSNGKLGAFLYNGSKFIRQVKFAELVKLLF